MQCVASGIETDATPRARMSALLSSRSPDRADALIGAIMSGIGARGDGAIGERELDGIHFGGRAALFDNEPVLFE